MKMPILKGLKSITSTTVQMMLLKNKVIAVKCKTLRNKEEYVVKCINIL